MSESGPSKEGSPPRPGGTPNQKKKGRPSKSQRDAARSGAMSLPLQQHPATGSSRVSAAKSFSAAASFAAAESSAPSFRPGSFPVVFNSAAEEASVDVWFTPEIPTIGEHAQFAFDSLQSSDGFVEFLANAGATSDDAVEKLDGEFEAAAVLCAAQSICHAHQTAGFPVGDFSPLLQSDLVHIRSVRQIMAQYGDVRFDRVGQRYSVKHYSETIKAFIRQAYKAKIAKSRSSRKNERSCWWLPVAKNDGRTRFILACRVASLVKSKDVGIIPDVTWLEERILPMTEGSKPAWLGSVLSESEVKTLEPLWGTFPDKAEKFVSSFGSSEFLALLDLKWSQPSASDLWWNVNFKEQVSKILDPWAARAPVLRKFFEVADKSISTGSTGSTAQFGSTDMFRGVLIASFSLDNGTAISSLASSFLPRSVFDPTKERDVKFTSTAPIGERAVAWVQRDYR